MRLVTNKYFEKYIEFKNLSRRFESVNRKNEDRWDTLDLDDITTDVETPSKSEIDAAVRELDLVDDAVLKGAEVNVKNNGDIEVDNRMSTLDFDDQGANIADFDAEDLFLTPAQRKERKKKQSIDKRIAGLDLDDTPMDVESSDDTKIRELDLDEHGADVKSKKSNLGGLGKLDIDDVDDSTIMATIDDVYVGLASDDGEIVKSLIKRYASDLKDAEKLKEIMLAHAVQGNYESLRAICGDMTITLTDREKELDYIDKGEINAALKRLRKLARSLTGEKNTYGLIPNAIANCKPNSQIKYINIVDFLHEMLGIPLFPIFYRGAIILHCYDMAEFIFNELDEDDLDSDLLFGKKGLINRTMDFTDIPDDIVVQVVKAAIPNKKAIANYRSNDLASIINYAARSEKAFGIVINRLNEYPNKAALVYDKLEGSNDNRLSDEQMNILDNIQ